MNQILCCDWLPERARWSYLARTGPSASHKEKNPESHMINPLLTKFVRSRWLDIVLLLFFASLWTSTRSINTQKKNLANIQPYCRFSHDVTKIQTTKLLILLIFYFNDVKEQLKTSIYTNFCSEWVLGFAIDYA